MTEKFYLVKLLTNTQGQDGSSLAVYDELEKAQIVYHQILSTYHNAEDVLYAVVEILDSYGRVINGCSEIVNHVPQPTPPEPETEE